MKPRLYAVLIAGLLLGSLHAVGQESFDMQRGLAPYGSFKGGDLDSVNMVNGNLSLHVPILSYPQRGKSLRLNYNIYYNDKQYLLNYHIGFQSVIGGWQLYDMAGTDSFWGHVGAYINRDQNISLQHIQTYATGTCQNNLGPCTQTITNYYIAGPDDSRHYYGNSGGGNGGCCYYNYGPAVDHSGYTVTGGIVADRDGIVGGTDVDGNYMTPTPAVSNPIGVKDTMGRVIPEPAATGLSQCSAGATSAQVWNVPGSTVPYYLCYTNLSYQTAFNVNGTYCGWGFSTAEASGTQTMLTEVVLPNSTRFKFAYDSYLSLIQMTLPTGGYISYTYQNVMLNCGNKGGPMSRVLASRTKNDGTTSSTWHYQWITDPQGFWFHVVTDPMGNDEVHHIGPTYNTVDWQTDSYTGCSTINAQYCTPGGTLLKKVKTDYQSDNDTYMMGASQFAIPPSPIPQARTTTVAATNKVSKTVYTMAPAAYTRTFYVFQGDVTLPLQTQSKDWSSGQIATVDDYDYGAGAPGAKIRSTTTTFQWQDSATGANYFNPNNYGVPNLIDLPKSVVVSDGSGHVCAETDYFFDEAAAYPPHSSGVTMQHTSAPNGSILGNTTTTKKQLSATPCQAGATWTSVTVQQAKLYDTGEDYQDIDARNLTTTHTYDPTFYGAYRTQSQMPDTGSVHHIVTGTYDFNTGLITTFTGQNGSPETTSYSWDFNMRRIQSATFPDTGVTSFTYNDTPGSLQVQMSQSQTTSTSIIKTVQFDNLGRTVHSILTDPEGNDTTDTTYDSVGRVATVSNPHRTAASSTDGVTQTQYDGLGRAVTITKQDGSRVQTSYTDTCAVNTNALATVVTDEAGKMRETCSDALGRLIEVDEPGAGALTGTSGTGTFTVGGGPDQSVVINPCQNNVPPAPTYCPYTAWDTGWVYITADGFTANAGFGQGSTTSALASALASALNVSSSPVNASVNGLTITITSKATGVAADYSISTSASWATQNFSYPSFTVCVTGASCTYTGSSSGATTGGTDSSVGSSPLVTLYTYDALGNLTCVVQKGTDTTTFTSCGAAPATWRPRSFTYDSFSRLLTANNPETGTVTYTYDSDTGCTSPNSYPMLLVSKKDARGLRTCLQYDNLNRVSKKTFPNGDPSITYTFDSGTNGIGRRSGMTDASGSSSWVFDVMGQVTTESLTIGSVNKSFVSAYNLDGSIKQVTYPTGSGSVLAYTYENSGGISAGRLGTVTDTAHSINYLQTTTSTTQPSYTPPGQLSLATYGSVKETGIYNNRLQPCWYYATTGTALDPTKACTFTTGAANVMDVKYGYSWGTNDNGEVLNTTNGKDSNRSVTYTYDMLNRIASASSGGTDCSVLPSGITKNWGETFTIDAWGNLTNETVTKCSVPSLTVIALANNRLSGFGYDSAGNMTSNGGSNYTYNSESQLATAVGVTYTYDGDGLRVKKSSGTEYWGTGPMLESDGSGNFQREYVFAGRRRIARRDISGGAVHYFMSDRLSSTAVVVSAVGAIENEYDYAPYGQERDYSTSISNQNYKFNGKERDSESQLDNFGARFYASTLGRFMIPDWAASPTSVPYAQLANPQSLNLYAYVMNSPVTTADLDGHVSEGAEQFFAEAEADFTNFVSRFGLPTCTSPVEGKQKTKPKAQNQTSPIVTAVASLLVGMARSNGVHHGVAQQFIKLLPKGEARTWLMKKFVTEEAEVPHGWSVAHKAYNEAQATMEELGSEEGRQQLVEEGARAAMRLGEKVLQSDNPAIKAFLDTNKTKSGDTFRESLEKTLEGDGEAAGELTSGAIGAGVETVVKDVPIE